jgi:diguanylate cyclase (GGDEF)-like protein
VFVDIDDFKDINDKKGHVVGDNILQVISTLFRNSLRETDIIARFGGDELIILLPGIDIEGGKKLVEKLRSILENSTEIQEMLSYKLTASFGISAYQENDDRETILHRVDKAMYLSKKKGKNRVSAL